MHDILPKNIKPVFRQHVPRADVRCKIQELLGLEEVPVNVGFAMGSAEVAEGISTTSLSFCNSLGEQVPGLLMKPLNGTARAGIVCIPGTSGSAERLADLRFCRSQSGPLFGWGRELVRRGFAVLAISPKGCEIRRKSLQHWAVENKLLAPYGRTQMGILVEETLRAARVLAAIEGIDAERIGLTGMSLGGNATWYAMACAPWIAAGVPICGGVGSLAKVIHQTDIERHSAYYFVPGLLRYFDHAEIVAACMPPRPFMVIAPTRDEDMPREGVDQLIQPVVEAYALSGHPECFKIYQPQGNHLFQMEYFERMVDFFKRFLASD